MQHVSKALVKSQKLVYSAQTRRFPPLSASPCCRTPPADGRCGFLPSPNQASGRRNLITQISQFISAFPSCFYSWPKSVSQPPSPDTARVTLIPPPPLTQTEHCARVPSRRMEQRGARPFPPVPIAPGFCSRGAVWPPTAFLASLEGAACRASRASGLLLMLPLSWERSLGADGSRGEGGSGFCRGKQILPLCPDE